MKRTTPELNKVWGSRALRAVLMILPLGLSGCSDGNLSPADSFGLAVSVSGSGQVTSSPAGIACGSDCAETLASGSTITLSATSASGAMFTGWSGDCSGGTPSCTLTMSASHAVTAIFTTNPPPPAAQYTLSVNVTGSGSVSSSPSGILCPSDCSETLAAGSNIILSATPASGYTFTGWSGDCSGTMSCTPAMSANRAVTATFTANPPQPVQSTLTVSKSGVGTVTSSSGTINCGSTCSVTVPIATPATSITLSAAAGSGYTFAGWSGAGIACPGIGTCTVSMSANRNVLASFTNNTTQILFEESFNNFSAYSPGIHVTEGARAEHSTGWNGDGAVKMYLGTPADPTWAHYSGWYRPTVDPLFFQSDRVHVRWCAQFGPTLFQSLGDGGKLLIIHRNVSNRDINPRVMAHIHNYSPAGRQLYSDNNIDNGPPIPPAFTLEDKAQQWMCFELGVSQQNNTREFWATVEGGPEVLLQTGSLNRTDGIWTGGTEFGYWGPVSNVDADSWWKLDELMVSNAKIGPPPGFAAP